MRLVRLVRREEDVVKSAKKPPHPHRRNPAHYPIHLKAKILSPHTPFAVLRQFSRVLPILTKARGETGDPALSVMQIIAGNRQYPDLFCITANV